MNMFHFRRDDKNSHRIQNNGIPWIIKFRYTNQANLLLYRTYINELKSIIYFKHLESYISMYNNCSHYHCRPPSSSKSQSHNLLYVQKSSIWRNVNQFFRSNYNINIITLTIKKNILMTLTNIINGMVNDYGTEI